MKIWMNGRLVDKNDATVSVFDHGLLYGDGVFEGIRVYAGRIFQCGAHLDRLQKSAASINLEIGYTNEELERGMYDLISGEDIPLERRVAGIVSYIFNYYKHHPDKLVFVLFTRNSFPDKYMERDEYNPDLIFVQMLSEEMAKATIPQADTALLLAMVRGLILEPIMMHRYGFLKTHPDKYTDLVIDKVWLVLKGSR